MPATKERFKFEPPFSQQGDASTWQYGERIHKAGEVIATTCWPNPGTMVALNYSARHVLEYFGGAQRSRLSRTPFRDGQIHLDDGLGAPLPRLTAIKASATRPQPHGADERVAPVDALAPVPAA
jgi:hypothetical protein